jgi:GT2 family glycosyltransferase
MIVRREVATKVGPLDEGLFMYGEDLEWCWRIQSAGWRIGVCAGTTFVHEPSSSARRTFGEEETGVRIAHGIDGACHRIYGSAHARALAGATAITLALEALSGRHGPPRRQALLAGARTWWRLARNPANRYEIDQA